MNTNVKENTLPAIKVTGFGKPQPLGKNGKPQKINEYHVQFIVWESVEATNEQEAQEILKDKIKHLHNDLDAVEINGLDIYNPKSRDYIFND